MPDIRTLLVANRGEIAVRIMRTARAMGIRTVAVYAEPDADAPHVRMADRAVALGGSSAADSYLRADKILDAARLTRADGIHPGYGFLSENAAFARSCGEAGLVFVGPTPESIQSMGLKDRAKDLARAAGVPVLPDALVNSDDLQAAQDAAAGVGYPLMVKAIAGGGGRGMRLVEEPGRLSEAIEGATREAASSFGDGRVFLERYLRSPRHVEVQVFGDRHSRCVHLFERECSVQRRHQKVLEESPSPAVAPTLRERMGATAVALAESLGYVGAGTVEFLLDGEGDDAPFYFLEMNTRLQVEHPVTEAVTGLDLVRLQLLVAMGEPLPISQDDVALSGHAIEVRLYAEDPAHDFRPSFGTMWRYAAPEDFRAGVRFDDGIATGNEVDTFYDPMLAKIITHAPTRREAAGRLARALDAMHLHGPTTNRAFLSAVLADPDFLAGRTRTDFIALHPELLDPSLPDGAALAHLAAAVATTAERRRTASGPGRLVPSGWRIYGGIAKRATWQRPGQAPVAVEYAVERDRLRLTVGGDGHDIGLRRLSPVSVQVTVDGVEHNCSVHHTSDGAVWVNDPSTQTSWAEAPRYPAPSSAVAAGNTVSEVPGTVTAVLVKAGEPVEAGDVLVVVEAMKMEHRITAPTSGVVAEVRVAEGSRVEAHQVLVVLED